tara:strand:- start:194 stop:370 length:177 start_codon:yes stop_codon:yes gene_type:complete
MGQLVNLMQFKKLKSRTEKGNRASKNSVRFGLTKEQRNIEEKKRSTENLRLDGHKFDP